MPAPAPQRYDIVTLGLHWLIALLIGLAYAASMLIEERPVGGGTGWAMTLHGSLGLSVFVLSLLRILWRGFGRHPTRVPVSGLMARAAQFAHIALYVMMVAVPVLGLLGLWARGQGIMVFWMLNLSSPFGPSRALAEFLGGAHELAANGLVILAGLHAAAAIFHQVFLGDRLLERMTPGTARDPS